jgi:4-amino-4-deoxy-L-arabinose transferase-like glycosyltransferase
MGPSIATVMPPRAARGTRVRWQAVFWTAWTVLLAARIALAANLAPFGDEAWYWQESRALDFSFSDLPPATAVLIRIGESIFGHGVLGMRAAFIVLGALLPLILVRTGARLFGSSAGWQAGLLALALPLLGVPGVFALPDVPLTFCAAVAFDALERAVRSDDGRAWVVLGVALAGAWLSHYRAAMLVLAGIVFMALSPRGRRLWAAPGLWTAAALSLAGLIPLLVFNLQHHWVALGFQVVDRNPWSFHADGLLQPLEQAIVCTPLFYALLIWTAWVCLRRARSAPWDLLAACSAVPLLAYLVLGCFADDTRLRLHWPLQGYLPLLIALPALLAEHDGGARFPRLRLAGLAAAFALLAAGTIATFAYFSLAAVPGGAVVLNRVKAFPEHWVGWNEVAARTRALLATPRFAGATLVAGNFMLAAELDFALDRTRPVYSLDHPINTKHGRAPQLALWHRDEAALRALGHQPLLIVVEPTARRERERAAWLAQVCARSAAPELVDRLELYGGRKRYLFLRAGGLSAAPAPPGNLDRPNCLDPAGP